MKYAQSSTPYLSVLIILLILAVFDAFGSVHKESKIVVDLVISAEEVPPSMSNSSSPKAELITQNQ